MGNAGGKIPIGLQLFSVRGECSKDLPATMKAVSDIGYVGVEPWGYAGDKLEWMGWPVKDVRKMIDDNGLKCCGIHLATVALMGDNLSRTIELNQELGNKFLIIAADSQRMSALNTIMELAELLNEVAEKLKPLGMLTGYHAHGFDFKEVDGRLAWDILFSNTNPEVVMQMDIGNCAGGGGDPIAELKQFPGRARSVHLKEYGGPPGSVIGEGEADWDLIFQLCETSHDTEWYVVEEGGREGLGFDVSQRSLEALKKMGK
jgi:sugar phosphate isomerase/epimerase